MTHCTGLKPNRKTTTHKLPFLPPSSFDSTGNTRRDHKWEQQFYWKTWNQHSSINKRGQKGRVLYAKKGVNKKKFKKKLKKHSPKRGEYPVVFARQRRDGTCHLHSLHTGPCGSGKQKKWMRQKSFCSLLSFPQPGKKWKTGTKQVLES